MVRNNKILLCVIGLLFISCQQNGFDPDIHISYLARYQWKTASLLSQNIDSIKIDSATAHLSTNRNLFSFVLVRNGLLVKEFYQPQLFSDNEFELRSATKSFVAALIGIALQKGLIDSIDQPMISFFPEFDSPNLDPRKRQITIRHLLTMRAGFDYTDYNPSPNMFTAKDHWVKQTIELPLLFNPGERFYYASIQTHLLSAIITKQSGMSTLEFGNKYLFGPAKIRIGKWDQDPQGIYFGGSGMVMSPRDMARFGLVMLQKGLVDSSSLIPSDWIKKTIMPNNSTNGSWGDFSALNYGLSWWTNYNNADSIYFAAGFGGQLIIVVPAKNTVIVTTANTYLPTELIGVQEEEIIRIIWRYIIPSLK